MSKERVFLVGSCRTPVGKLGSRLKDVPAQELLRTCFAETIRRSGIDVSLLDEAIVGTCMHDPDAMNVARVAVLLAGLGEDAVKTYLTKGILPRGVVAESSTVTIPAYTPSRNCGSSLQSIICGTQGIRAGDHSAVLVGGTESMSHAPFMISRGSCGYRQRDAVAIDSLVHGLTDPLTGELMGLTAEHVAEKRGIRREEQDEFAAASHAKALAAVNQGKFDGQIVPVTTRERDVMGDITEKTVSRDEGPLPKLTAAKLAGLPPYFKKGGTVTAGNSCMVNDGAASMILVTQSMAEAYGMKPEAEVMSYATVALDPSHMGEGPISAIPEALEKAGLQISDVGVFEINEAFAVVPLAAQKALRIAPETMNISGGAIALGHPVGATGAILTVKAIHLLEELQKEFAVISLCVGGGQGVALVIRNVP